METSTRQDKLLFFGITFISLAALTFSINHIKPILGISLAYLMLIPLLFSSVITGVKFGFRQLIEKYNSTNTYLISSIIWSVLASMKWLKYFNKNNFNWIMASLFTLVAVINWVSFFRENNK